MTRKLRGKLIANENVDVPSALRSQTITIFPLLVCLPVCPLSLARKLGMINSSNIDGKGKKVEYCFQCNLYFYYFIIYMRVEIAIDVDLELDFIDPLYLILFLHMVSPTI